MSSSGRVRLPFWRVQVVALALALSLGCLLPTAQAQALSLDSDPVAMGRLALGEMKHGAAAVGVWREGQARFVLVPAGDTAPTAVPGADAPPLFEIGSISKVFTGLLLAQAVERGDLALDDRLGDLLAGKVAFSSPDAASITLRQLVTHSSCLPRLPADFQTGSARESPYRNYDRPRMWAALAATQLAKAPPCQALYSNLGFGVLGEVLSERYGKPWSELVRERITAPLGMNDTLQHLGEQAPRLAAGYVGRLPAPPWDMQAFSGAGALRSTTADMLLFSRAILAGRSGPLGPAAERLLTPLGHIDIGEIGYGVWIRGTAQRRTFFHEGWTGGYRTVWMVMPATQEALVLLTSNGQAQPWRVRNAVSAAYYPLDAMPAQPYLVPGDELALYGGLYRSEQLGTVSFVAQDGVLYRRPAATTFRPLAPAGADVFVDAEQGLTYRFSREDGRPNRATLSQGGGQAALTRVDAGPPVLAVLPAAEAAAYVGRFVEQRLLKADRVFDVRASAGQLAVKLDNQLRYPVFPVPDQRDRFAYDVVKAELQFERDAAGKVVALVLHQNGEIRALRSDD